MNRTNFDRLVNELDLYPTDTESLQVQTLEADLKKIEQVVNAVHIARLLEILQCICVAVEKIESHIVQDRKLRKV